MLFSRQLQVDQLINMLDFDSLTREQFQLILNDPKSDHLSSGQRLERNRLIKEVARPYLTRLKVPAERFRAVLGEMYDKRFSSEAGSPRSESKTAATKSQDLESLELRELAEVARRALDLYFERTHCYPPVTYDISMGGHNVVFTLSGQTTDAGDKMLVTRSGGDDDSDDDDSDDESYVVKFGGKTWSFPYEADSQDVAKLEAFMRQHCPSVLKRLNDGDLVRLMRQDYRNSGVFIMHRGKLVELEFDDAPHDYGSVPMPLRRWYPTTWSQYGFHENLPEYGTSQANDNLERKQRLIKLLG